MWEGWVGEGEISMNGSLFPRITRICQSANRKCLKLWDYLIYDLADDADQHPISVNDLRYLRYLIIVYSKMQFRS